MTKIIIARHGETEWNVNEIFRGRQNVRLNKLGIKQAEQLGNHMKNESVQAIYSSPLKRAIDTATYVAKHHGLDVNVTSELTDFNYGVWEGLTRQEVSDKYRGLYEQWLKEPHLVKIPGGESLEQVRDRARSLVDRVVLKNNDTVVLVSHRVVIKVLTCSMLNLENSYFWYIKQDLGGITIFKYEGRHYKLIKHNDTSHLSQIQQHLLNDF